MSAPRLLSSLAAIALIASVAPARAQPPQRLVTPDRTLVLVAPPAVLLDAVETSLAPWQIRIVVIPAADAPPTAIADAHQAGFVAIGAGGVLHLYDRAAGDQARPMPADLDEADAAALALTIKTWMRLGPAPTADGAPAPIEVARPIAPPPPPRAWQLAASAALGVRANQGGLDAMQARVVLTAGVATRPVEVLAGVDLGPGDQVRTGMQPADWTQQAFFVRAARRFPLVDGLALRPVAGLSALRVAIDGHQFASGQSFAMSTWNLGLDGAVELGWQSGHIGAHVVAGITAVPTSQRLHDRSVNFELPAHLEPWAAIGAQARF